VGAVGHIKAELIEGMLQPGNGDRHIDLLARASRNAAEDGLESRRGSGCRRGSCG
jgi:hypothetical protein